MPSNTHLTSRPQRWEICTRSVHLDVPVETVFAFCTSRAGFIAHYPNPILSYRGAELWELGSEFWMDYRFLGFPTSWHGKVTEFELNRSFTDVMISGVLRYWEHTHTVEPDATGTKYTDTVHFSMGFGRLIDRYIVKPMLDTFFQRRHDMLVAALRAGQSASGANGASGTSTPLISHADRV